MNGRVYGINRKQNRVAIETELHGFTIVELLSEANLEMGDEMSWDSETNLGTQTFSNMSTNRPIEVFVHSHFVNKSGLRQHLLIA